MAFMAPIVGAITSAAPTLKLIGAGIGAVSNFASLSYQAALSKRQAAFYRQEKEITLQTAAVEAQDADLAAKQEIGIMTAKQAASGFSSTSASFERSQKAANLLARRDAFRIIQAGDRRALALEEQALQADASARQSKMSSYFALGSGLLDFSSTLIDNASLVNERKARQINRDRIRTI